jgi:hypothetical protein
MLKKISLSLVLSFCLCLAASAKGRIENPNSKWLKIARQASAHVKAGQHSKSHAKKSEKNPYIITTLNWDNGSSTYADSSEKIVLEWNADSTPNRVIIYQYGTVMTRIVVDSFKNIPGGAEFNELEFLGDWLPMEAKIYAKVLGQWVLGQRLTFTYTSRGNEEILTEEWTGSSWVNSEREFNMFDTHDMPLGYLSQEWENGDWSNVSGERVDFYYTDDFPDSALYTEMPNGGTDWTTPTDGIVKEVFTTNMFDEVGSALIYWADGAMDSIGGITWKNYTPGDQDFLFVGGSEYEEYTAYTWDNMWIPSAHFTKTYNSSNMEIEQVTRTWDENTAQWINQSRTTQEYETITGEVKERLNFDWTGTQWVQSFGERYTNSYDGDDDLIAQTYETYDGSNWVKISKTIYSYTPPVGIKAPAAIASVKMYPNPATSRLIVELNTAGKNSVVSVFDLNGKLISTTTTAANKLTVDTGNLNAGTYILRVQSGYSLQTSSFVKR